MRTSTKKSLAALDDVLAERSHPGLLSDEAPSVPPHQLRMKDGMAIVQGIPHLLECSLVRVILRGPHYMLSPGEVQPLTGPTVRCDCGSIRHAVGR